MDFIDDLLAEVKQEKKAEKKKKKLGEAATTPGPIPYEIDPQNADAVVLLTFNATCGRCNSKFTYPNEKLLVRVDRNLTKPKKWLHVHDTLPKEVVVRELQLERCNNCYESSVHDLIARGV